MKSKLIGGHLLRRLRAWGSSLLCGSVMFFLLHGYISHHLRFRYFLKIILPKPQNKKKKIEILFSFLNFLVSLLHNSYNLCPYFRLISPVVTCCTFSQSRVGNSDRSLFLCRTFLHFLWLPHHNHTLKKTKTQVILVCLVILKKWSLSTLQELLAA